MLREFTQKVGRYNVGSQHDYPRDVWKNIARDVGQPLDKFTKGIESNAVLQSALKGRVRIHKRLGATA
jgi:hypothetical protein